MSDIEGKVTWVGASECGQTNEFQNANRRNAPRTRTCYAALRQPNKRAGRNKIERTSAKRASKVIPTRRKGSESSHTKGKIIKARSANGHEITKRRHQTRRASRVFTQLAFHSRIKRQLGAKAK